MGWSTNNGYQRFGETNCLHLQGLLWRCKQHVPPKRSYLSTKLLYAATRKTTICTLTALTTWAFIGSMGHKLIKNWKYCGGNRSWLNLSYSLCIFLEWARKTTVKISSPVGDLNSGRLEYETRIWRSVICGLIATVKWKSELGKVWQKPRHVFILSV